MVNTVAPPRRGAPVSEVPSTTAAPRLAHMPALDGVRGLAVASVLLFHAGHLEGGWLGVDLFFVLSGFLITSLLLAEGTGRQRVRLTAFWARRARRLLPALGVLLLGVAAYAVLLADPDELARIRADGLATLAYVANWRTVVADTDYFELFTSPSPLQHTWSVAIEEQFYVVWPLVVVALLRWRGAARLAGTVLVGSLALAAGSLALMLALYEPGDRMRVYFGTDTRMASILLGAALAAGLALRGPVRSRRARRGLEVAGLAGAAVLAVAWATADGRSDWVYQGGLFALALAGVAVLAVAAHPEPGPLNRALSLAPLRQLGLISYGAYLYHWPVYVVLDEARTGIEGWPLVAVRVAVTLAVAVVSYRLVEQPIRTGALRPRQLRVLAPAFATVVLAALLVGTTGARSDAEVEAEAVGSLGDAVREAEAAPPATQRLLVVGNSVSLYLGEAFDELEVDPPLVTANRGLLGCTFPTGWTRVRLGDGTPWDGGSDCTTTWRDDVAAFDPDLVLFAMGDPGDADFEYGGEWLHPCQAAYDDLYRDGLEEAVDVLSSGGATVAIMSPAYSDLPFASEVRFERADCVNAVNRTVAEARPEAEHVDVNGYLCTASGECRKEIDGVELRSDGVHYRDAGGRFIAEWTLSQLR